MYVILSEKYSITSKCKLNTLKTIYIMNFEDKKINLK